MPALDRRVIKSGQNRLNAVISQGRRLPPAGGGGPRRDPLFLTNAGHALLRVGQTGKRRARPPA
jgi:hypothetical protein